MRILLTADTVGGVWDYTCTLAGALDAAGHEVLVAVIGELSERHAGLPVGVEVAYRPYLLEWMPDCEDDLAECNRWIARLAELWRADVVHLNQYACALERFEVPTVVVGHSDVLSWFSETLSADAPPQWTAYAERVRRGLGMATVVVTPTGYQSALLQRHYGRGADRVIHNGASPVAPSGGVGERIVVCAARAWDEAKGVRVLDQALGRLGAGAPPSHLLGALVSPDGAEVHPRHLRAHGALGRAEVDGWLERAALYVSPSLYEPFGLAPLEAAMHGCALILSDIGSYRELWDGCAAFFPAGDAGALAAVLERLGHDAEEVQRLAAAARTRALRRYTASRMCEQYLELYAELHAGSGRRSGGRLAGQPA